MSKCLLHDKYLQTCMPSISPLSSPFICLFDFSYLLFISSSPAIQDLLSYFYLDNDVQLHVHQAGYHDFCQDQPETSMTVSEFSAVGGHLCMYFNPI